jgi:CHAT domain-containing protein/Tfp pilus assembly protein PilF
VGCRQKTTSDPESLYQDASLKLKQGDLSGALASVESVTSKKSPANGEWAWRFEVLKAEILMRQGNQQEALSLLQQEPPAQLESSDSAVWRKMTQGAAESFLGAYGDSEKFLNDAESLARISHPELLGEVTLRKGTLAFLRGDFPAAQREYRKALEIARRQNDAYLEVASVGSLGLVATKREHYDESIDWNREALRLSERAGAQDSRAYILGNMGWSFVGMGDYDNALTLFQQADEASAKSGAFSAQVDWKVNLGNVYLAEGRYDQADSEYQNALVLANKLGDDGAKAECYENLALVSLERGQIESAQQYNEKVAPLAHDHSDLVVSKIVAGRIDAERKQYRDAEDIFVSVTKDPEAPTSLRWEAQSRLADAYASEGKLVQADSEFRHAIATIASARATIQSEELRLSFLSTAILFYNDYIEFLISQGRTDDALQVAEVSRAQALSEGLELKSKISYPLANFQPRSIARQAGATLLFYRLGELHSYLWVIRREGISLFTLPPAAEIELLVKSYREALVGPRDVLETSDAHGIQLYEMLVAPAQKLIAPGSRVIVLPDRALYGLNFETLLASSPQPHYWIDDAVVENANSLVLLAASGKAPLSKSRKLLLIGNPLSPSQEFPDLPQADSEMSDVEGYFAAPDRTVLSRQQATPSGYLHSSPEQYSYIHFVAHGTASRTSPLDSAVILTKEGESYKLYARDIVTQPLNADLVTISACSGVGERTYSGEGLVGLSWAFLRAGAHGVIAALWEVNDNSTPELMNDMYGQISKGAAPDAALRHAKLTLLHSGTIYKKPFYWAPFEIYRGH